MVEPENIFEIIRKNEIPIPVNALALDKPLTDQGVDSLDMTTILFAVEERFQLRIAEEDMDSGKLSSVNAIIEFVNRV
ncbi:MAG: acyl carrier protein, partial [Desulfobacterales bacterium]|nr:acyl carrier protein [Desulfobacterales bacterium]